MFSKTKSTLYLNSPFFEDAANGSANIRGSGSLADVKTCRAGVRDVGHTKPWKIGPSLEQGQKGAGPNQLLANAGPNRLGFRLAPKLLHKLVSRMKDAQSLPSYQTGPSIVPY